MANVNLIMYAIIGVVVLYGFLKGMRKGLYKSLIDLGVVIVAIVLSVFVAKLLAKYLVDTASLMWAFDKLIELMPASSDLLLAIKNSIVEMAARSNAIGLAMALPAIIFAPFIYMFIYLGIASVLKIPKMIIARSIFGKNSGETYRGGNRVAGGAVGTVARLVSFVAFVIPVVGYIMLANTVMTNIGNSSIREIPLSNPTAELMSEEDGELEQEIVAEEASAQTMGEKITSIGNSCIQVRDEFVAPIANNPICKAVQSFGGKWIFNALSSAKIAETKITLEDEMLVLTNIYHEATALLKTPSAQYGSVQTAAINNIATILDDAKIAPTLISNTLSYTSTTWLEGRAAFGASKIIVSDYYVPTFDKLLVMFSQTTEATVKADIHTLADIVNLCIDENAFVEVSNNTPVNIVKNEEFVGQLFVELYENDRTRPIAGDLINSFKNYLYKVYNAVNDEEQPYPPQIDINILSKEQVYQEGKLVASIMTDFTEFYATVDMEETDNTKFLIQTDVRSFGRALDKIEKSLFLGDSYTFLLSAVLKSRGASQFAFMTPEFVDAVINRKTSMETVLVSRQQIAILLSVTKEEGRDDAIKHILENVDKESADVIKETLTTEVLGEFGMDEIQSESMSNTLNSMIDQIVANEDGYTDEQLEVEIEAVGSIVDVVKGATNSQDGNLFGGETDESKTGMTADDFVSTVVNSNILSSAIKDAVKDEDGNKVEDPYKISSGITDSDKESTKNAIEEYYSNNQLADGDNTQLKETLGSLANLFGVDVNLE